MSLSRMDRTEYITAKDLIEGETVMVDGEMLALEAGEVTHLQEQMRVRVKNNVIAKHMRTSPYRSLRLDQGLWVGTRTPATEVMADDYVRRDTMAFWAKVESNQVTMGGAVITLQVGRTILQCLEDEQLWVVRK